MSIDTGRPEKQSPSRASLRSRIVSGGSVTLVGYGLSQVMRLGSNLIMTRLLSQEAFGLMAIAFAMQLLLVMVSDLGINASIIRSKRGDDPDFLSTAWMTQIGRGLIIALAMILSAVIVPLLAANGTFPEASVFNDPRMGIFLGVIGVSAGIEAFKSTKVALYERRMDFPRVIAIELCAQLFGIVIMVVTAQRGAGAYSLLIGMLCTNISLVLASHLLLRGPRIRLVFCRDYFDEIFGFGKWLILASLFGFLMQRGDQFIFGALLASSAFGFYAIATIWIGGLILLNEKIIARIIFPSFSEILRDRPNDMTTVYYRFRRVLDIVFATGFIVASFSVDRIFSILYTDQYDAVVDYLRLMLPIMIFLPYRILNTAILASGASRNYVAIVLCPTLAILVGVPLVYEVAGARTAILATTLAFTTALPLALWFSRGLIKHDWRRESPLLAFGLAMVWMVYRHGPAPLT